MTLLELIELQLSLDESLELNGSQNPQDTNDRSTSWGLNWTGKPLHALRTSLMHNSGPLNCSKLLSWLFNKTNGIALMFLPPRGEGGLRLEKLSTKTEIKQKKVKPNMTDTARSSKSDSDNEIDTSIDQSIDPTRNIDPIELGSESINENEWQLLHSNIDKCIELHGMQRIQDITKYLGSFDEDLVQDIAFIPIPAAMVAWVQSEITSNKLGFESSSEYVTSLIRKEILPPLDGSIIKDLTIVLEKIIELQDKIDKVDNSLQNIKKITSEVSNDLNTRKAMQYVSNPNPVDQNELDLQNDEEARIWIDMLDKSGVEINYVASDGHTGGSGGLHWSDGVSIIELHFNRAPIPLAHQLMDLSNNEIKGLFALLVEIIHYEYLVKYLDPDVSEVVALSNNHLPLDKRFASINVEIDYCESIGSFHEQKDSAKGEIFLKMAFNKAPNHIAVGLLDLAKSKMLHVFANVVALANRKLNDVKNL